MKKNKGFTLIELLAIIVILAVIAVITVPIILNIIENSHKGAAKDSAYGYKDSINKYYMSKLANDPNFEVADGTYTVGSLDVSSEGKQPGSNSWVTITKNKVTGGCLQFDEYKVEIENETVKDAVKGECTTNVPTMDDMCPGCVFTDYTRHPDTEILVGSVLTNFVTDYNDLSSNVFLGYIIDADDGNKITDAFACGIIQDVPFCAKATSDSEEKAKVIDDLTMLFSEPHEDDYGNIGWSFNSDSSGISLISSGNVDVWNEYSCSVEVSGSTGCYGS